MEQKQVQSLVPEQKQQTKQTQAQKLTNDYLTQLANRIRNRAFQIDETTGQMIRTESIPKTEQTQKTSSLLIIKPIAKQTEKEKKSRLFVIPQFAQAQKQRQNQGLGFVPFSLTGLQTIEPAQSQQQNQKEAIPTIQTPRFVTPKTSPFLQSELLYPTPNTQQQQEKMTRPFGLGFGNFNYLLGSAGGKKQRKGRGIKSFFAYSVNPNIVGAIEQAGLPGLQTSSSSAIFGKVDKQLQKATRLNVKGSKIRF